MDFYRVHTQDREISKNVPCKALLISDNAPAHPNEEELNSDGMQPVCCSQQTKMYCNI
jgi:hypothetical protein